MPAMRFQACHIRTPHPDEAAALTEIAHAAKRGVGYPDTWLASWRDALTVRDSALAAWSVFVAEQDGKPVGFIATSPKADHHEIEHLWVLPEYQHRGIGHALMSRAAAHARAKGCARVRIESDPSAEPFYRSLGAERIGEIPAPMPGAPDRVLPVLVLELSRDAAAERTVRTIAP